MTAEGVLVIQHVPAEHTGTLGGVLTERVPPRVDAYGGVVVMGGPMGADQRRKHPYLAHEAAFGAFAELVKATRSAARDR